MDRVYTSGATGVPPAAPALPSTGYPQKANPGLGIQATRPGPWWFHMITEELRAVIAAAGITPNHTDLTQLSTAIRRMIDGGDYKPSARVATTANIVLSGVQTIDGVAVVDGDRVLVKAQTAGAENGIYVAAAGAWARSTDADTAGDLTSGVLVPVEAGTSNTDTTWMLTTDGAITIGTTALVFISTMVGDASTIVKGKVQLATSAESQAFTDPLKALTPATLAAALKGGNQSLSSIGFQKLPGGLIIQWCSGAPTTTGDSTQVVNFPIAFPTAVLQVFVSTIAASNVISDGWMQELSSSRTLTGVTTIFQWNGSGNVASGATPCVLAIGY